MGLLNGLGFCYGCLLFQWLSIDRRIDIAGRELDAVESLNFPTTNPASEDIPDAVADQEWVSTGTTPATGATHPATAAIPEAAGDHVLEQSGSTDLPTIHPAPEATE